MIKVEVGVKPLSINRCLYGKRFKTKEYKAYEELLLTLLPKKKMIEGKRLSLFVKIFLKHPLQVDGDNLVKPLADILQKAGYFRDDRYIFDYIIQKRQRSYNGIQIEIREI